MEPAAGDCLRRSASPAADSSAPPLRQHAAALVGSDAELASVAVPFLQLGLEVGDLTVVSAPRDTVAVLEKELGERAGAVESDSRLCLLDTRAPDALSATRSLLDRAASARSGWLRLVGQVQFGDRPLTWREGERYEAAAAALLADAPMATMCLYDSRRVPDEVMAGARCTHPELVVDGVTVPSADFVQPVEFLRRLQIPVESVEATPPVLAVDDAPSLVDLRHALGAVLDALVPDRELADDLHLAVSEVAANAFRHGVRPVSARAWVDDGQIVCSITDRGRSYDNPLAGFEPAHGSDLGRGGMGLWLARKLWDSVDLMPGPHGFTVRLSARLS